MKRLKDWSIQICLIAFLTSPVLAFYNPGESHKEDLKRVNGKRPYSPYVDRNYPTRPFFGDTHLHTGIRHATLCVN